MKICSFGAPGAEQAGLVDADGQVRDVSSVVQGWTAAHLQPGGLAAFEGLDLAQFPVVASDVRIGVPFTGTSKYICIGLNYSDHAAESGLAVPTEPLVFMKAPSAICGPNDDTIMPVGCTQLDWEVELGIVIGRQARNVSQDAALDHVFGYVLLNDVSERAFQFQSSQWDKGKGCDSFGPVGPFVARKEHIADPMALNLWLSVNGERRQDGNTRTMVFGISEIVSYVSRFMTLQPGDIIATGTPPGVGMGCKPSPIWLKEGDVVELGADGLGSQRQVVVRQ
jgi:2,4-diketo-3-deoxy-L-fuconate hydrolase